MSLPHQRVKGRLKWIWWVPGSTQPQSTILISSDYVFNGTSGYGQYLNPHPGGLTRSDQDSVRAAGVASSTIRNTGVKAGWRYYTIKDLLIDAQVMLGQMVCAAYIHMYKLYDTKLVDPFKRTAYTGGEILMCTRSCLFPSQPSNIVEGVATWANAKEGGIVQVVVFKACLKKCDLEKYRRRSQELAQGLRAAAP
eukprot:1153771-Pelagomonas_calceolata.AAC.1